MVTFPSIWDAAFTKAIGLAKIRQNPQCARYPQGCGEALRKIKVPVMRWPGGCFADEYHWMDGIGPREKRPSMVNTHWGGLVENNHFGTHEFMELCAQIECEPYICGNVGSGTVQEMSQWVEYLTFDGKSPMTGIAPAATARRMPWQLKYFGVGNENWGCGGRMTPEYYSDLYRRYGLYARNYGDNKLYRIACGARNDDYHWTEVMMEKAGDPKGCSAAPIWTGWRYIITPPSSACRTVRASARPPNSMRPNGSRSCSKGLFMEELVRRHGTIMDKFDPGK